MIGGTDDRAARTLSPLPWRASQQGAKGFFQTLCRAAKFGHLRNRHARCCARCRRCTARTSFQAALEVWIIALHYLAQGVARPNVVTGIGEPGERTHGSV